MLPPKTAEDCLRLITTAEAYYINAVQGFKEDDQFYEGLIEGLVEVPEGFELSIPTTARAIIDEAVDNIEPYEMSVKYPPRSFGKAPQQDAENVGRFLKNNWENWRQKNSDIDVLRDFIKNLFKNGKAIFKCVPDWSLYPSLSDAEEKKILAEEGKEGLRNRVNIIKQLRSENFPVVCRSLSPLHVFEDPTMDSRKLWVIEKYDSSVEEVRNRFAQYEDFFLTYEEFDIPVKEVWTATWVDWDGKINYGKHFVFIQNECVLEEDNPYHDVPYVIKHSGFGTETYDGKPERKAVGFFSRQVKSMLLAEIRRITQFDAMMQQLAFPILVLPDIFEDQVFDTDPGAINYVPEDMMQYMATIYLQAKLPAPEYMQSISMIQNQIERGTTQRAVRGAGVPGTDSAAQLAMVTSQAKLRLEPTKRSTEEAVDMVNAMVLRYIYEIFGEEMSVFGAEPTGPETYKCKPSMIKGRYRTKTIFLPNEEQVRERKLVLATDAMSKAKLNPYDALTFAGFDNAMEIISRNLAYTIMEEPAVKRQLAKQALKDWGLDTMELELEELNDSSMLEQMKQQIMSQMQGAAPPQSPVAPQDGGGGPSGPQGGGGMMPQPTQQAPQAIGAPTGMPMQPAPDISAMRGMQPGG